MAFRGVGRWFAGTGGWGRMLSNALDSNGDTIDDATIVAPAAGRLVERATIAPVTIAAGTIEYHLPIGDNRSASRRRRERGRSASLGAMVRSKCADVRVADAHVIVA